MYWIMADQLCSRTTAGSVSRTSAICFAYARTSAEGTWWQSMQFRTKRAFSSRSLIPVSHADAGALPAWLAVPRMMTVSSADKSAGAGEYGNDVGTAVRAVPTQRHHGLANWLAVQVNDNASDRDLGRQWRRQQARQRAQRYGGQMTPCSAACKCADLGDRDRPSIPHPWSSRRTDCRNRPSDRSGTGCSPGRCSRPVPGLRTTGYPRRWSRGRCRHPGR